MSRAFTLFPAIFPGFSGFTLLYQRESCPAFVSDFTFVLRSFWPCPAIVSDFTFILRSFRPCPAIFSDFTLMYHILGVFPGLSRALPCSLLGFPPFCRTLSLFRCIIGILGLVPSLFRTLLDRRFPIVHIVILEGGAFYQVRVLGAILEHPGLVVQRSPRRICYDLGWPHCSPRALLYFES